MGFEEDLRTFTNANDFGIIATLGGKNISGIFDRGYEETASDSVYGVESRNPSFTCQSKDLPISIDEEIAVIIPGIGSFRIKDVMPDGTGITRISLYSD